MTFSGAGSLDSANVFLTQVTVNGHAYNLLSLGITATYLHLGTRFLATIHSGFFIGGPDVTRRTA